MKLAGILSAALVLAFVGCASAAEPEADEPVAQESPPPSASTPAPAPEAPDDEVEPVTSSDAEHALEITESRQRKEAVGKTVQITGTVRREKPGDSIARDRFDLLCPDFRFDDALVGTTVTVVGVLERQHTPAATVSSSGEISQGPSLPSARYILRGCALK